MAYWTLQEVMDKVNKDLDLEHESIVQQTEFVGYVNDAVREVVDELNRAGVEDKYYRSYATLPLVNGTKEYDFPANILKNKITEIVYDDNNGEIYPIRRIKGQDIYSRIAEMEYNSNVNDIFRYTIFSFAPSVGDKIRIVPTPKKNYATEVTIYFIRQAEELELDDDGTGLVDCPEEFIGFVLSYVKWRCTGKEIGNPMYAEYKEEKELMRERMSATLTGQVEDGDNKLPLDTSIYEEHS